MVDDFSSTSRANSSPRALLSQLTREEKTAMLHQHSPAVDRVGLAAFRTGTEGLHGLSWLGTATVFPQPVGLAASWDPALLEQVAQAIAAEVRAKNAEDDTVSLNVWAPVVNTLRHPLWGRTEEGYSEDPDLTAALATGFCRGLRGTGAVWTTVPTLKHFLAYGNETDRAVTSSHLPPQALREYELPAFRGPLAAGVVGAVMPSYNLVNGRPSHVSAELLDELRDYAPQSIAVVSDAQAPSNLVDGERHFPDHVTSHAAALAAGVDSFTDNGEDAAPTFTRLTTALDTGLVSEAVVDRAVLRMLELRERTGEFSGELPEAAPRPIDHPAHRTLARTTAARGVVLLTNDGALPLGSPERIAVVGAYADHAAQDWYSGTPPYQSTLADAVAERYPDAEVVRADGADRVALFSRSQSRYLATGDQGFVEASGLAPEGAALWDVTDWGDGVLSIRSATSKLLLTSAPYTLIRAVAPRIGGWVAQETFRMHDRGDGTVSLEHIGSGRWLRVQRGTGLLVADGFPDTAERFDRTVIRSAATAIAEVSKDADVTIVAVGNDPHIAGRETEDRPGLALPASARAALEVAAAHSRSTVLAIVSSYPYAIEEEALVADAVVWSSHAGQELGHGLVDVLSGDVAPSGRLAQTWWRAAADAGDLFEYDVVGAGMTYRYADAEPLFALGHGLSYATVAYEGIRLSEASIDAPEPTVVHEPARHGSDPRRAHDLVATVSVRNTGDRPVDELVAVWALAPALPVPAPRRRLAGWTRVTLAAGEAADVELAIPHGIFAVWDAAATAADGARTSTPGAFVVQGAQYILATGPSVADLPQSARLVVTAPAAPLRPRGAVATHGFHAAQAVVTSDRSRTHGHSIELAPDAEEGWARFDRVDLGGAMSATVTVAMRRRTASTPSTLTLSFRASTTSMWVPLAPPVTVQTTGPYDWQELSLPLGARSAETGDLRVELTGAARLAEIAFHDERTRTP